MAYGEYFYFSLPLFGLIFSLIYDQIKASHARSFQSVAHSFIDHLPHERLPRRILPVSQAGLWPPRKLNG